MAKIKVKVLDGHTLQYPDGTIVERSSHPMQGPENPGDVWHAALAQFVPREKMDAPFEAEIDED